MPGSMPANLFFYACIPRPESQVLIGAGSRCPKQGENKLSMFMNCVIIYQFPSVDVQWNENIPSGFFLPLFYLQRVPLNISPSQGPYVRNPQAGETTKQEGAPDFRPQLPAYRRIGKSGAIF